MPIRPIIAVVVIGFVLAGCTKLSVPQLNSTNQGTTFSGSIIGFIFNSLYHVGTKKKTANDTNTVTKDVPPAHYTWSQQMEKQKRQMQAVAVNTDTQIYKTHENRLKLEIPSTSTFGNNAHIRPNILPFMNSFASSLKQNPDTYITIVGHTNKPGNNIINNALLFKHASNIREYLVQQGVLLQRINISGPGSRESFATNDTKIDSATNHRIEIYVFEL